MSGFDLEQRRLEAEISWYEAETKKFLSEAASADADTAIKLAEARQKKAHAIAAEHGAEAMRIQTDAQRRQERLSLAGNHHHHEYMFTTDVRQDEVDTCLAQMAVWHRIDPECDMHITMNSPGGSLIDGMHLFDQILLYSKRPWDKSKKNPRGKHSTTMTVRGYAASMAGILLQAADERVIGAHSLLMIHEVASIAMGKIGDIKDEVKMLDKVSQDVIDIFVTRSGRITKEEFADKWNRTDWWLTAHEALELGFVDRIG